MRTIAALVLLLSARQSWALSKTAEENLDKGLHHLYSLEYPESRAAFRKIIEAEPDNPFGYLFESGAIWWQSSMEYGLFKGTPTLQGLFEQDVEHALRKVDAWEASKDKAVSADGHFAEGMALGTRGQWSIMRGHWLRAYFDGKKAVKHLRKAVKIDPEYYDAELGLGVFDYQAAHFSGALKIGAALGGLRGDEKKGLERMALAAEKGRYGRRQAAQFLSSIYIIDKRDYAKALPLIESLRRDFPESVYFELVELALRFKLRQNLESLALGRSIFDKIKADPPAFNRKLLSLLCGFAGDKCLNQEDATAAKAWLDAAIEESELASKAAAKGKKPLTKGKKAELDVERQRLSLLHLFRGYAHDVLGHSDDASADFQKVLALPAFSDNHERAKECLEESCDAQALLARFQKLSHP
jgi:hypothetical protein